ncbi:MAG: hypothetical protein IKC97_06580, partial [Clostridia bacterium]|nr:hypothetical protein [Clostridia bacterium]
LFANPEDIKIRKIIVNTFVREVILYDDKVIITYNFTDTIEPHKINTETITETERQIDSAFSLKSGSYILPATAPKGKEVNLWFTSLPFYPYKSMLSLSHDGGAWIYF